MIGIFDSGSGGLTVLKEIRKVQPKADIVYLGDIKNAPYGSKSREELGALTVGLVRKLIDEGATRIVSACNSVSASIALPMFSIWEISPIDMIEMVGPTAKELKEETRPILLVATKATIDSQIYQSALGAFNKEVYSLAMPELAGAIEFGASEKEIETLVKKYLKKSEIKKGLLVLACTHYPLVRDVFKKVIKKNKWEFELFDPATAVATSVKKWKERGEGKMRFLSTKESEPFRKRVQEMFGSLYSVEIIGGEII